MGWNHQLASNLPSHIGHGATPKNPPQDALERSTAQRVVGVSICWAYREHKDSDATSNYPLCN